MWYADTFFSKVKLIRGNACANVSTQGKFKKVVSMTARSDAGQSLVDFTDNVGITDRLVTDGAGEFTVKGNQFRERGAPHADTTTNQQTGSEEP